MPDCVFCSIARKEIPSDVLYEDGSFLVFRDINPQAPFHALVIPKEHYATILEAPDDEVIGQVSRVIKAVATEHGLAEKGFRVVVNTGEEGGQTVNHLHFHILGGRPMQWPPG